MPIFLARVRTSGSWLLTVRPTMASLSPYFSWSFTKLGISMRQGPHHVAQKSRIITLPWKSDRRTFFPVRSVSSKSGALDPMAPAFADKAPFSAPALFSCVPERAQPNARTRARIAIDFLEDRIVFLQLVVGDAGPVPIPFDPLVLDEFRE